MRGLRNYIACICAVFVFAPHSIYVLSRTNGFYLEIPYAQQIKNYCGPASLEMVFRHWNQPTDQHELASHFVPFPSKGLSGAQLKKLAVRYGFDAYSFTGDSKLLKEHLQKGRPLVVALESSGLLNRNHFVVLVGWDESKQDWLVHDPAKGPYQRYSAKKFGKQWRQLENWTLLVIPASGK